MIVTPATDLSRLEDGDRLEVEAFREFLGRRQLEIDDIVRAFLEQRRPFVLTAVDHAYAAGRLPAIHYLRELDPT